MSLTLLAVLETISPVLLSYTVYFVLLCFVVVSGGLPFSDTGHLKTGLWKGGSGEGVEGGEIVVGLCCMKENFIFNKD